VYHFQIFDAVLNQEFYEVMLKPKLAYVLNILPRKSFVFSVGKLDGVLNR